MEDSANERKALRSTYEGEIKKQKKLARFSVKT